MATYAIGDVQGCFASLLALLDAIHFNRDHDDLWFAGDLVNRGPESLAVLRFVRNLGDRATTVLGNHDLHLLAVAHTQQDLREEDTLTEVLEAPDCEALCMWLRHRPFLHHDTSRKVSLVHAGLPPQWTLAQALNYARAAQDVLQGPHCTEFLAKIVKKTSKMWTPTLTHWEQLCYSTHCFTLLRYCDATGQLALDQKGPPGTQPKPYLPWFSIQQRAHQVPKDQTILFGHWAALGAYTAPGIYALDTGCVWGGHLSALCLETMERASVKCRETSLTPMS